MNLLTSRRLSYSVGFGLSEKIAGLIRALPEDAWTPSYNSDGKPREGARAAELTGVMDMSSWPTGMRVIRAESPHPRAQLRFTDMDGYRFTEFATNTSRGQLGLLELRQRHRARCEDRIRNAKDSGLRKLPLHDFAQNEVAIVQLPPN